MRRAGGGNDDVGVSSGVIKLLKENGPAGKLVGQLERSLMRAVGDENRAGAMRDQVPRGKFAHLAGIPLASLGAFAYFVAFSLAILVLFGYGFARQVLAVLVGIMFLTSLWLLYLQAFVIHHFCQYCLLSAAVTILLTVIVFAAIIARRRGMAF